VPYFSRVFYTSPTSLYILLSSTPTSILSLDFPFHRCVVLRNQPYGPIPSVRYLTEGTQVLTCGTSFFFPPNRRKRRCLLEGISCSYQITVDRRRLLPRAAPAAHLQPTPARRSLAARRARHGSVASALAILPQRRVRVKQRPTSSRAAPLPFHFHFQIQIQIPAK
jgi:hypothetical protein